MLLSRVFSACTAAVLVAGVLATGIASAKDYDYASIARRHQDAALSTAQLNDARMQGDCLVGLKQLNFKRRADFDAVSEWTNYRSISLLEQFPPCTVLVIMEVARDALMEEQSETQ